MLFIASTMNLNAQIVSKEEAMEKAKTFFAENPNRPHKHLQVPRKPAQLQLANSRNEFFVFNDERNGGFVVVSGDERMPAVLGYSYDGHYEEGKEPENMRFWLEGYVSQVEYLKTHPGLKKVRQNTVQGNAISPMLDCHWSQWSPYNNFCPNGSPTGCVPTAMAQLIFYYKWPSKTTATIPGYTTNDYTIPSIPITEIDWSNLIPSYDYGYSPKQANAVATLMKMCGTAVNVIYNDASSGAASSMIANALVNYFDYDQGVVLYQDHYESDKWCQMMYDELADGHPIPYSGKGSGGHSFIIDGYDKNDYFHINWGWGGESDGFFLLTALTPSGNDFNNDKSAIFGIRPSKPGMASPYAVLDNGKMTFYFDDQKNSRTGTIYKNIRDCASNNAEVRECVIDPSVSKFKIWSVGGFFKDSENLESIKGLGNINMQDVKRMWQMFDGCKSLKEIDLKGFKTNDVTNMGCAFANCSSLVTLDLTEFVTNNVTRTDYMFQDCSSLQTIFVNDGWNMDNVTDSWWMFVNDYALMGTKGSTYHYPEWGAGYAHIDEGPDNPGYMSHSTMKGDLDGNMEVSVNDVACIVNIILGIPNTWSFPVNGDMNYDGVVDVNDICATVLLIINHEYKPPIYLKCPDNHHPHMIDLGLPSGTKWACCNVGADKPEAYGSLYAWGETEEKDYYYWDTYTHCDGERNTCHDLGSNITGTVHDIAHVKWGGLWGIPSLNQFQELLDNCTSEWITVNGVKGRKFSSKNNGGSIFLPAAGQWQDQYLMGRDANGFYWSSTLRPSDMSLAYYLFFYSDDTSTGRTYRCFGYSLRPIEK